MSARRSRLGGRIEVAARALADRAARMWGVKLDPTLPAADFIASMSTAGMVTLTRPAATHKEES